MPQHQGSSTDQPTRNIFVGRAREMAELQAALASAANGRGQLVLLAGEPGIGKTRLTEELAIFARQRGMQVLWGRCWEGNGAPVFWPWMQIVRSSLQHCPPETLAAEMGTGAAAIAEVITEVRDRLPDLPAPPAVSPEQARFRFFDSLTAWLKKAATRQPLLLILDDLHWADIPSLRLLHFLARELHNARLLALGTYRDTEVDRGHPLSDVLGAVARESHHIIVSGLTVDDVARFIESTTGIPPVQSLVAAVHQRTEGNPFFLHELVRLLHTEGRLTDPDASSTLSSSIPQGVRETIRLRLAQLSAACTRLLTDAAVIGHEFNLNLLEHVYRQDRGTERGALLTVLHEALTAHIISEEPNDVGRYRFVHALIRETLYEELSLPERIQLHRLVGEAMEKLYAAYLRPYLAELADHFFKAALGGDVDKAVRYAIQAGERATVLLAYEEAANHYERALQLLPSNESAAAQRCELQLALGEAQAQAGEAKKARATFLQAVAVARELPQRGEKNQAATFLARAALGVAGRGDIATRFDRAMVDLLEEALVALPEEESPLRVRVLARLAMALYFSPFAERRDDLSQQAVEMARRLGSPTTLAYALSARHMALIGPGTVAERLTLAMEVIQLAEEGGRKEIAAVGHLWRLMDVLELGDIAAVDLEIHTYGRLAEELRQPFYFWQTTVLRAMRALLEGHFAEGEQLVQGGLTLGQRAQTPNAFLLCAVQFFGLRREQGRMQELEDAFKGLVEHYPAIPALRPALAFLYSELGREAEARDEFERLATNDFLDLPRDQGWLTAMALLSQVASFLGDTRRAASLYERLLPYAELNVVVGSATDCYGSVSRYLGLLAATLARWDDAERHFAAALAMNGRMGAHPLVARTQYEHARMFVTRGQAGDYEKAKILLDLALATAQELGMTSLEEKIQFQVSSFKFQVQGSKFKVQSGEARSQKAVASSQHGKSQDQGSKTSDSGLRTPDSRVPSPQHPTPNTQSPVPNVFRQEGDYWTIGYEGTSVQLHDAKGLHHLVCLLREPGREFHVLDLLAMTDTPPPVSTSAGPSAQLAPRYLRVSQLTESRALPDRHAKAAYQRRLVDLRDELEEAERFNDSDRATKVRAEIDFITTELTATYGVSAHARTRSADAEKARKTVTNRIRTVLTKIQKVHPALWRHLSTALKTGTFCSYNPEKPITWQF